MISIIKPGLLTTIQDLGRFGYRKYGVVTSGAMDTYSMRLANILVGNDERKATLEITMVGPKLKIRGGTLMAIVGGEFCVKLNGIQIPQQRPIYIKQDSILEFGKCINGLRCYIAIAGGFDVPSVMESKSTYIKAEIGGYEGRAIKAADKIYFGKKSTISEKIINNLIVQNSNEYFSTTKWLVKNDFYYSNQVEIRVIRGRQYNKFNDESKKNFYDKTYVVTTDSDRMGYRLKGKKLELTEEFEMISEAVSLGTIQVPKDGNPIILLSDCQTTGGYPIIGQIAVVDIKKVAQLKPNDNIKFKEISIELATELFINREKYLKYIKGIINVLFTT